MFLRLKNFMSPYLIYGRRLILAAALAVVIIFIILSTKQHPSMQNGNILEKLGLQKKDNLTSQMKKEPKISMSVSQCTGQSYKKNLKSQEHVNISRDPLKTLNYNSTVNKKEMHRQNNTNEKQLNTKHQNFTINKKKESSTNRNFTRLDLNVTLNKAKGPEPTKIKALTFSLNKANTSTTMKLVPLSNNNETAGLNNTNANPIISQQNITIASASIKEVPLPNLKPKDYINVEPLKSDQQNLTLSKEKSHVFNDTNKKHQKLVPKIINASTALDNVILTSLKSQGKMNVEQLKTDRPRLSLKKENLPKFNKTNARLLKTSHQNISLNMEKVSTAAQNVLLPSLSTENNTNLKPIKPDHINLSLNKDKTPIVNNTKASSFQQITLNVEKAPKPKTLNAGPSNKIPQNKTAHKEKSSTNIENILLSSSQPTPGRTMFFLDTSQHHSNAPYNMGNMRAHQACAIESAALHNPNFQVFLLFASPTQRNESVPLIQALLSYKNVQFRELNLESYARDTPLADWYKKRPLIRSRYALFHAGDLVRLITLYRFGGIYLDMDVIVLRSLEDEPLNYAGAETKTSIGNAVLSLEPNGFGHHLGELLMREFQKNFVKRTWAHQGAMTLARVLSEVCGTANVTLMLNDRQRCHGFRVFNVSAFYAVPWEQTHLFFDPKHERETLERTKNSLLVHIWNHIATKWPLKITSKAAYIKLAAQHCPKVSAAAGDVFH